MTTKSIDIAAFLYLRGVLPDRMTRPGFVYSTFEYADSSRVRDLVAEFNGGGMVPAREFAEARVLMKDHGRVGRMMLMAKRRHTDVAIQTGTDLPAP